jgi:hypothetical protein
MIGKQSGRGIIGLVFIAMSCAAAPPGPRGPLMGPGAEIALDYSYAYGQGAAVLEDGSRTSGRADYYWTELAVIPRRLEARVSPVAWMDVGGQIGWVDGGADLRIGLPARPGDSRAFQPRSVSSASAARRDDAPRTGGRHRLRPVPS